MKNGPERPQFPVFWPKKGQKWHYSIKIATYNLQSPLYNLKSNFYGSKRHIRLISDQLLIANGLNRV